jgi:hypothetical protein
LLDYQQYGFFACLPCHAGYSLKLLIINLLQYTTYLKCLHGYVLTSAIAYLPLVRLLAISGHTKLSNLSSIVPLLPNLPYFGRNGVDTEGIYR